MDHDVPIKARWIADFINRIGFPIFAFCVLAVAYFWQLDHMRISYESNTARIVESVDKNTMAITALRHFLTHKYDE